MEECIHRRNRTQMPAQWMNTKKKTLTIRPHIHLQRHLNQIEVGTTVFTVGCFIQCKLTQKPFKPWCGYILCGREEKVNPGQAYINYPSLHTIFLLSFWYAWLARCPTLDGASYPNVFGSTQTPGATPTLPQGCCCCWHTI